MGIVNLREVLARLDDIAYNADKAARDAVAKTAALAESEAKKAFQGSHAKGEPHVGGEAPNVVTGTLRRSIRTDPITQYSLGDYGTVIAPRAKYGRRVELGYPGGTGPGHQHTNPHPYFIPAAKKAREAFRDIAAAQWRTFLH